MPRKKRSKKDLERELRSTQTMLAAARKKLAGKAEGEGDGDSTHAGASGGGADPAGAVQRGGTAQPGAAAEDTQPPDVDDINDELKAKKPDDKTSKEADDGKPRSWFG